MIGFHSVSKQYGRQVLFLDASFQFDPGEKVGLVGPNGAGKSTVFRLILGEETADDGHIERPKRLTIGIFRQDVGDWSEGTVLAVTQGGAGEVAQLAEKLAHLEVRLEDYEADDYDDVLERYGDVQERFSALGGYELEPQAAKILAGLGLTKDQIMGPISALSGGWKMRVALARCLLSGASVMVLDEPTNHLDMTSSQVMERALVHFPGAVVVVSHDRFFIDKVATRQIVFGVPGAAPGELRVQGR